MLTPTSTEKSSALRSKTSFDVGLSNCERIACAIPSASPTATWNEAGVTSGSAARKTDWGANPTPGVLSTSKYLGGDAYEESVLIQVNIVTDSDTVVIHDTQALAPELVAFTEETEQPTPECPAPVVCDPAQNDNLMGNIMV